MSDPDAHPLDALRAPVVPLAPDPAFAASLRARLARALQTDDPANPEEVPMAGIEVTGEVLLRDGLSRNGTRKGDIAYIALHVPDLDRARAFYGRVLGWRFAAGRLDAAGGQVDDVIPQVGLFASPAGSGVAAQRAVLAFRVDDLDEALAAVRAQGGTAGEPREDPFGRSADCRDPQGLAFALHQLPPPGGNTPENGTAPGDLSYVTLPVPDSAIARDFYGAVLGWRFSSTGRGDGWSVEGPRPEMGLAGGRAEAAGAVLCYRVADLAAAVLAVREAGGTATDPAERPYGLESTCTDDQGTPFYLHELHGGAAS